MVSPTKFDRSKLRGLILDMDGVLWRGTAPLGDLPAIFKTIAASGLRVIMATNNASRSPQQYVEKLSALGVTVEPWQVINSGLATAHYLKERYPKGGNVFVVGEESLVEILKNSGFPPGKDPVAVVAALDRGITYQKLTDATLLIRSGVPFIGTNPDISFPMPEGQAPGAGAILAALETATGVSPTIIGKPQPEMYKVALERLRTSPEATLVVGDRLETDILGAQRAGCPSGLVLSGVTSLEAARKWRPTPDLIADDLTQLLAIVTGE
jgi:4-nitrophenyl phosphatase